MNTKVINQDIMGRKISEQSLLKFIKDSSEWILEKRLTNCNGLTILKRIN